MAINAEKLTVTPLRRTTDPSPTVWLKRLVDNGTLYVPQNLTLAQFATLQAITLLLSYPGSHYAASRLDACLATSAGNAEPDAPPPPIAFDYHLGLDELETITRTRTGYSFAELTSDLQDAILSLIATRDLTTRKLDLALWLEHLHIQTLALAA
ncbi:hypothetical protein [Granulicella sp. S190]|uniref:hypothetical protein n=1 Tax=Granulicella sp. S190 TaxID=1747226 RepID=UPI00131EA588|nr:hypothetical protein [Granulicella sp. S190]